MPYGTDKKPSRAGRSRFSGRYGLRAALAICLGLLLVYFFLSPTGFYRLWRLEGRRHSLDREIDSLERQITETRQEIERLKSDKAYLEKLAREKLGMARPGEKVYKFVDDTAR